MAARRDITAHTDDAFFGFTIGTMKRRQLVVLVVAFTAALASAKEHKRHVAHKEQHKEQKPVQHPVMERAEEAKPLYPFVFPFVYPWWDSTATAKFGEAWKDMRNKFTAWWLAYPMMCAASHHASSWHESGGTFALIVALRALAGCGGHSCGSGRGRGPGRCTIRCGGAGTERCCFL